MSVSLLSRNVARKLLFIQFLAVIASGLLFSLKDPFWGISAVCGVWRFSAKRVVYDFCLASSGAYTSQRPRGLVLRLRRSVKVLLTFALLVMALAVLKVVFMPLIATWVLVLVVQVLAPAVINNKG
jgi:ATP synthase protein I